MAKTNDKDQKIRTNEIHILPSLTSTAPHPSKDDHNIMNNSTPNTEDISDFVATLLDLSKDCKVLNQDYGREKH